VGNEDELMIIEKVEEQDLREIKIVMDNRLLEFRDEWNEMKQLNIQAENE
jgi:hypothetical protein